MTKFHSHFQYKRWLVVLCILIGLTACQPDTKPLSDLEQIQQRGVLRVGTLNNQISYFIGTDGPTGLDYELAQRFAKELGVKLEIKPAYHSSGLFPALKNHEVDMIAAGISHTPERLKHFNVGPAYYYASQQVVYRKGTWRPRNLKQLIEKQSSENKENFVVVKGSEFDQTLQNLAKDNPKLTWETVENNDTNDLLKKVSTGDIDFTVVDSISLSINQRLHPRLATAFELTEDQPISWYIRKSDNDSLYAMMLEFFGNMNQSGKLTRLEEKYFGHIQSFDYVDTRAFIRSLDSKLPKYKKLFQTYSKEFDWRLIAALSYQESHWNPYATSPTGVRGMMMLTQSTAKMVNVKNRLIPAQSIQGGVTYLRGIVKRIPDSIPEHEKIWFALASYNLGFGHVMDARRLTKAQKANPDSWTDVKARLPKLQLPGYYRYTRYGYARGSEAKNYVENIRRYYQTIIGYEAQEKQEIRNDNRDADFTVIDAPVSSAVSAAVSTATNTEQPAAESK
ncbi:membrane-bound lytic murein transglycosylase MltF [Vibrio sp. S11_S32]|uniref:membrane-bound lytic murein transglycosylase MltF n=1 Tax=Vibrio sp. S11_S32 TaxID=2720225 RepID=UPI00167FF3D7|nr:membrane-bound lytic murein transglycosylase MltF [Vibrio sp. S11_S32]MBD1575146.1 membrane-bound lytic murein transglycosylase MltF [Vibrio sp. S11_S32]